jgi:hypothetical protein
LKKERKRKKVRSEEGMFSARNQLRWFEEEWRRKNEREVEEIEEPVLQVLAKVEKMEEQVVEVGAVKEVGLSKGAKPP